MIRFCLIASMLALAVAGKAPRECNSAGTSWVEDKIKYVCSVDGDVKKAKAVACLFRGKEYAAGDQWTTASFKFQCKQDENGLSISVTTCIKPDGEELGIGAVSAVAGKGRYQCTQNKTGWVTRKFQKGCIVGDSFYRAGRTWFSGNTTLECFEGANKDEYLVKATACKADKDVWINVGTYFQYVSSNSHVKCERSKEDPSIANLVPANAQGYNRWFKQYADVQDA